MATQTLVVNEGDNGTWLVFWQLRDVPEQTSENVLTASATFQCADKYFRMIFHFTPMQAELHFDNISQGFPLTSQFYFIL